MNNLTAAEQSIATIKQNQALMATQLTAIANGIQALDTAIQNLRAQIASSSASTLSADDQQALNDLATQSGALAAQAQAINTAVPDGSVTRSPTTSPPSTPTWSSN